MSVFLLLLWRPLRAIALVLAAGVLAIEEWGWRPLTRWASRMAAWPPLARMESHVRRASPRTALLLFMVPAVALFPVKLLALWLISEGRTGLGIFVIVMAKLLGTAIVGRLFIVTETQLMQFAWFARALNWWRTTKLRVREAMRRSALWQAASRVRRRVWICFRRMAR